MFVGAMYLCLDQLKSRNPRFESIVDYEKRKRERAEKLLTPVKIVKVVNVALYPYRVIFKALYFIILKYTTFSIYSESMTI